MYKIISFCIAVLACWCTAAGQISCTNATYRTLTNYTNGMSNDSLFFICNTQTATLVATPPTGTPGWNFTWQQFSAASNNWNPLIVANNVPTSQLSNLQPGGYRVIITDGASVNVGEYIVWICRVNVNPTVNVLPIAAGCSNVQLQAQVNAGTITPYYNPPIINNNPSNSLMIGPGTSIQICYTGTHSWISDLGFYLVGPASCGSPTILLSPNPGSNGQYYICNGSDNFTNLCFSNQSTAIFNPCSPGTYSGTYGGYGPGGGTMINWNALNGCDASQPGWAVQVYDCVSGDIGSLTGANITFNGTSVGGAPVTYNYASQSGFSSPIADNSCLPSTASIFHVPAAPAQQITFPLSYQWTADPPFTIPNSTSSLNIQLNPGPTVDTQFTLTLTGTHPGAICGGTSTDTELFDYLPPVTPELNTPVTTLCLSDDPITLTSSINGGSWNGPGIASASSGIFNPTIAGEGTHTITYSMGGSCTPQASISIVVVDNPTIAITPIQTLCSTDASVTLEATPAGGTWSGEGTTSLGQFNPSTAGSGNHTLYYQVNGLCPAIDSISVSIEPAIQPSITVPTEICINSTNLTFNSSPAGGTWTGTIVTQSGQFIAPNSSGTYTVSYGFNSACSGTASATVEVIDQTSVYITPVSGICTNTAVFTLSANQPGGTWSGTGIENAATGAFNPSIAGSGNHVVTYTIPGTCPAIGQTTINIAPFIQPIITTPAALCSNDSPISLNASPAGGTWSGVGVTNNGTFDPSSLGTSNAEVTYQITGDCPSSTSSTILINAAPTVSVAGNSAICAGEVTTLTANGATQYNWSPSLGLSSPQNAITDASPNSSTTYTVTGTTNGCSSSTQFVLTVNPLPIIIISGEVNICEGDTTQLFASGAESYIWSPSSGLSSTNIAQPEATPLLTTVYSVTGTDPLGCSNTASVDVNVFHAYFDASPTEGTLPLSVEFTNLSGGVSATWNFGDGESYVSFNPNEIVNHIYTDMGLFEAMLSITYPGIVCSSTQQILVFANSEILLIPNIVTADGNGANDHFRISLVGIKSVDVQIFDRWGKNVGELKTPDDSWNPRDNGDGIYFYTLKAEGFDKKNFERSGYFHVVR